MLMQRSNNRKPLNAIVIDSNENLETAILNPSNRKREKISGSLCCCQLHTSTLYQCARRSRIMQHCLHTLSMSTSKAKHFAETSAVVRIKRNKWNKWQLNKTTCTISMFDTFCEWDKRCTHAFRDNCERWRITFCRQRMLKYWIWSVSNWNLKTILKCLAIDMLIHFVILIDSIFIDIYSTAT